MQKHTASRRRFLRGLTGALTLVGVGCAVWSLSAPGVTPPPPGLSPQTQPPTQGDSTPPLAQVTPPAPSTDTPDLPLKPLKPPVIHAASAILIDAVSGQVLYERNADTPRPMASTTKIMTALLFCECVPDNAVITASKYASETTGSSLHLKPGEKVGANDLLHAILMRSANDACVAAAEHIAGSEQAFVDRMNARARELGALHTHFANPHGLNADDHYTTARDLAMIARAALQEPRFSDVVRTKTYRIARSMDKQDLTLRNHSHFLGKFPGADGVKTGWTVPAGHCYVGSATWNGWRLISVVLHSPDYVDETRILMRYGFRNFEPHALAKAGESLGAYPIKSGLPPSVPVLVKDSLQYVARKGENLPVDRHIQMIPLTAPVAQGTQIGMLETYSGARKLGETPLITGAAVARDPAAAAIISRSPWKSALVWLGMVGLGVGALRVWMRSGLRRALRRRERHYPSGLGG